MEMAEKTELNATQTAMLIQTVVDLINLNNKLCSP